MEVKQHPNDMIYGKMNIKYNNMWIYNVIFCVYFSGMEAGLNLTLDLSNTSPV